MRNQTDDWTPLTSIVYFFPILYYMEVNAAHHLFGYQYSSKYLLFLLIERLSK